MIWRVESSDNSSHDGRFDLAAELIRTICEPEQGVQLHEAGETGISLKPNLVQGDAFTLWVTDGYGPKQRLRIERDTFVFHWSYLLRVCIRADNDDLFFVEEAHVRPPLEPYLVPGVIETLRRYPAKITGLLADLRGEDTLSPSDAANNATDGFSAAARKLRGWTLAMHHDDLTELLKIGLSE